MEFDLIADRPVLDFVATVAERGSSDVEYLRSPSDLADWIDQAGLLDRRPTVTTADLAEARRARDAMFRVVAARIDARVPSDSDRQLVNDVASRQGPVVTLSRNGRVHRRGDVSAVLAELARDCLRLYADADGDALHWCADARCTRPFVDRSRGHRRRWCGMKGCGDRAKAATYRARRRAAASA